MTRHIPPAPCLVLRCLPMLLLLLAVCPQPASADTLRILDDNEDALRARFDLIGGARRQIVCSCFELRADEVTYAFLAHLQRAARRGVDVRLVADAYGNKIAPSVLGEVVRSGVQIRLYHPLRPKNLCRYTRRLHDKLLIADRRAMIMGGRNLGNVYYGLSREKNFIDSEVEVTGGAVEQAAGYFEELWASESVSPVRCCGRHLDAAERRSRMICDSPSGVWLPTAAQLLARGSALVRGEIARSPQPRGRTHVVPRGGIFFVHSLKHAPDGSSDISDALLGMIASAEREIIIETPYLCLSERFESALRAAVCRGVRVRLLGNSLASIDKPLAHAGYINQKQAMQKMGVELWEYSGPDMLHAKAFLIDDCAILGSYDLHPRSEHYDTEVAIIVPDAEFTAAYRAVVQQHLDSSVQVGRPGGYRITRWLTGRPPFSRVLQMKMLRLPALFLKKHM